MLEAATKPSLYREVVAHYHACTRGELSDHWAHTLAAKGSLYSEAEMTEMLVPGSRVNARIRDIAYLNDASVIDGGDPIQARLLALGEPEIGKPRREIEIGGKLYSSAFVNMVPLAARIVVEIERAGIERPRIMEVGGGFGLLTALLRSYYTARASLILVDVRESLLIQEWYLRRAFPDANVSFQPTAAPVAPAAGGITFVNAFALGDMPIDVALTINTLQDLTATQANAYVVYFERNMRPGGVYFFRTSTGPTEGSPGEPTEYAFGRGWKLQSIGMAHQIETCLPVEELQIVLRRDAAGEDPAARRSKLREAWNGFYALDLQSELPPAKRAGTLDTYRLTAHLWRAQTKLIEAMRAADASPIAAICAELDQDFVGNGAERSEYWTALLAGYVLPLIGAASLGERLAAAASRTRSRSWRVRMVHLLAAYGEKQLALAALPQIKDDAALALKCAEIAHACGDAARARETVDAMPRTLYTDPILAPTLAKTAIRIGDAMTFEAVCRALPDAGAVIDLLDFGLALMGASKTGALHDALALKDEESVAYGALLARLKRDSGPAMLARIERAAGDSYYRMGSLARTYQSLGEDEAGERCFARSIELKPGSFTHHEFMGGVFLAAGRFERAAAEYARASALRPNLRHLAGRAAWCRLPEAERASCKFGRAQDLALIFQRDQGFYHDIGPQTK